MSETATFDPEPMTSSFAQEPPNDLDAERAVLGAMLQSPTAITDVVELVRSPDFYRPGHQIIFESMIALSEQHGAVDPVLAFDYLQSNGLLARAGGGGYLHTIVASVPVVSHASYYAGIVREQAILRRTGEAADRVKGWILNRSGETADELVERTLEEFGKVIGVRRSEDYALLGELMPDALDQIEANGARGGEISGVPTGFLDLDALTHGLQPGEMVVVAARPAIGKSTLALDFLRHAAIKHHMASVFFSLEMNRREIVMRLLSAEARVALHNIRGGTLNDDDWAKLARKIGEVADAPLFIDDSPNMSMMEIRAKCRRLKAKNNLRFVVIDYLQLMSSPVKTETRQNEVSEISRQIKLLAKELEVPIIAVSQLNRGPEQRTDKQPLISDLRESGSIEQDADMVMLLSRPDAYEKESTRAGEADIIVAKHRNGPTATITVAFQGHYSRFVDMAPNH